MTVAPGAAPDAVVPWHPVEPQDYLGLPRPRFPLDQSSYDWSRQLYPYPAVAPDH